MGADNTLQSLIRHQFHGPPAGIVLREHWLVVVLWDILSQDACESSHADFWIIAEGFYQNDRRCRGRHLWARRGCYSPRLQASGSEEADTGRRSVSRPPEGKPKLRQLSLFRLAQQLRCGRRRDQRIGLVPHVHDVSPARSRRAWVEQIPLS